MATLTSFFFLLFFIISHLSIHPSGQSDNFCFQCESINQSKPGCDQINLDDSLYLVDCSGGYCTKTIKTTNGVTSQTTRTCEKADVNEVDFGCNNVEDDMICRCDTSYCNRIDHLTANDLLISIGCCVAIFIYY